MNRILFWLIMLPRGLWKAMGADITQLKAILDVKLKMDDRKPLGFGRPQKDGKRKPAKNTSLRAMLISFFMGFLYIFPLIAFRSSPVLGLTLFFNLLLLLLTFALISDFSNILIDTRDKLIIFPKPVTDRTILLSRVLHISIYFFRFVFPMTLPSWIVFGMLHGWKGAVLFPIPLILLCAFCLFIVMAVYALLIRMFSAQRFKNILNSFQIVFTIIIIGCSYFLPRIMDSETMQKVTFDMIPWVRFLPTYWLATCWLWVSPHAQMIQGTAWMSALAVVVPFICLWLTLKFLAPSFITKISGLDSAENTVRKKNAKSGGKSSLYLRLANVFNKSPEAKAGFIITWLQSSRSRTFRMRVYPSIGFVPLYFAYIVTMNGKSLSETWQNLPHTNTHLLLLYLTGFVIMNAITYVTMSEQYKAAWVYYSSPVVSPGKVLSGMFKAVWVKFYLPFIAIIGGFVLYVWGASAIFDVLLAMVNVTLYVVCTMRISNRMLPFSMPEMIKQSGGKGVLRVLMVFVLMGVFGFSHYLITYLFNAVTESSTWGFLKAFFLVFKLLFLAMSAIFTWLVWDGYTNTTWEGIKKSEEAY
ncbi:MAG: hypothetical protein JST82_05360 [Bacteroidetes bacterium]|nr:hypothetical protein [Bacteroidota bacterium]